MISRKKSILTLFFLGSVFYLSKLWEGYVRSDALVYAQVAKELLRSGNPLILTFAGKPYFNKPPLLFWLVSVNYKLFGINAFSVKFWPSFFGVMSGISIYLLCRRFMDEWSAFFSGVVILLTRDFIKDNVMFHFESSVVFFTVLSFYILLKDELTVLDGLLSGFFLGLALLSKGFPGFLGPVVLMITFLLVRRFRERVLFAPFIIYLCFGVSMFSVWFLYQLGVFGLSFWKIFVGREVLERASGASGFSKGSFYYFGEVLKNYWPWLPFLPVSVYVLFKEHESRVFKALIASWFFVAAFSIAPLRPQYGRYLNYIYPVFAIPIGYFLGSFLKSPERIREWILRISVFSFMVINILPVRLHRPYYKDLMEIYPVLKNKLDAGYRLYLYRPPSRRLWQALLFYFDLKAGEVKSCSSIPERSIVLTLKGHEAELSCLMPVLKWGRYVVLEKVPTSRTHPRTSKASPFQPQRRL